MFWWKLTTNLNHIWTGKRPRIEITILKKNEVRNLTSQTPRLIKLQEFGNYLELRIDK